jgi:hypothetical protein
MRMALEQRARSSVHRSAVRTTFTESPLIVDATDSAEAARERADEFGRQAEVVMDNDGLEAEVSEQSFGVRLATCEGYVGELVDEERIAIDVERGRSERVLARSDIYVRAVGDAESIDEIPYFAREVEEAERRGDHTEAE